MCRQLEPPQWAVVHRWPAPVVRHSLGLAPVVHPWGAPLVRRCLLEAPPETTGSVLPQAMLVYRGLALRVHPGMALGAAAYQG